MSACSRFPSKRESPAVELGADELISRLEWVLRDRPRALRNARRRYADFCRHEYQHLKQAGRRRSGHIHRLVRKAA